MNHLGILRAFLFILYLSTSSDAACYFPQEYQGEYVMQNTASVGNGIQYSTMNIYENAIPIWGWCHRRIDNKFILMVNISETSCARCVHLKLRSPNVLQIFTSTKQSISQCYTNAEAAEENCPSEESFYTHETSEILFIKKPDVPGARIAKQYCPFDGKYTASYNGYEKVSCNSFDSLAHACPSGSTLNIHLKNCTTKSLDFNFECLANWKGPYNEKFLVFADRRQNPIYRCGLYKQHPRTGVIKMALSSDSTCSTNLINSTYGSEVFTFYPKAENDWPIEVSSFSMCTFPKWMRGEWENMHVDENTIVYRDQTTFTTYHIKCAGAQEDGSKYLIFARSQCDQEQYNCMRVVKRSNNILEFQMGINASLNDDFTACADENFENDKWITQGRIDSSPDMISGMCPITGEYTGVIPDNPELCTKLWSDCRTPELMYYQVSQCDTNQVYEEREYKCLGHWNESGLLYTYTQRRDIAADMYECFVGSIISEYEIYIKEASEHCQRHIDPLQYGMKLNKKQLYSCISHGNIPKILTDVEYTTTTTANIPRYTLPTPPTRTTMRTWNFDNSITDSNNNQSSAEGVFTQFSIFFIIIFAHLIKRMFYPEYY